MNRFLTILFMLCLFSFGQSAFAQDTTEVKKEKMLVIKQDGGIYTGYILSDDAREILLESDQVGQLYIPKHLIKSIEVYDPSKPVEETVVQPVIQQEPVIDIEKPDSNEYETYVSTKNLLSDNALPLRKGEAFIRFMPIGFEAGIPITKNWSIQPFASYWGLPVGIKTKFSFQLSDLAYMSLDLGYGSMAFGSWADLGIRDGGGVASTTFTFGDRSRNFSVKAGYGYIHEQWWDWEFDEITQTWDITGPTMNYTHLIFANAGGMFEVNNRSSFVFDALIATMNGEFIAAGGAAGRWGKNPRRQWQVGGSLVFSTDVFIPIPMLNASFTFVFPERNQD